MISKTTPLSIIEQLAPACKCSACAHGCTMGSGFLAASDMKPLAVFLNVSEEQLKEKHLEEAEQFNTKLWRPKVERKNGKPYGKCILYDKEKGCTVHQAKPLQCKVSMGCKEYGDDLHAWFILNHAVNPHDPESIRQYQTYIDAGGKVIQGGAIEELVPDKEKRQSMLNFAMLK